MTYGIEGRKAWSMTDGWPLSFSMNNKLDFVSRTSAIMKTTHLASQINQSNSVISL